MTWGFSDTRKFCTNHHFYFSDWYLSYPSVTTVFFATSCVSCTIFHGARCITWCLLLIWVCVWGLRCCGRKEEWWERTCELCHRLLRASSHTAKTCVASTSHTFWVTLATPALRSLTVSIPINYTFGSELNNVKNSLSLLVIERWLYFSEHYFFEWTWFFEAVC